MHTYCFNGVLTFAIVLERFYLVFWPDEGEDGKVSVHANTDLKGPQEKAREVGSACLVSFGKKLFSGQIAAVGKLALSTYLFHYKNSNHS